MVKVATKTAYLDRPSSSILFESEKFYSLSVLQSYLDEILKSPADLNIDMIHGDRWGFFVEATYGITLKVSGGWILADFWACDEQICEDYKFLKVKDMNVCDSDEIESLIADSLNDIVDKYKGRIESLVEDRYNEAKTDAQQIEDTEDFLRRNPY